MQWASSTASRGTCEPAEDRSKARVAQALRSDVDDPVGSLPQARHAAPHLLGGKRRGQERGGDAAGLEGRDLVVHQRHEGRDDERGPFEERGRELIGEALPSSRGRHEEEPARVEERLDGFALAGAEGVVAEAGESCVEIGGSIGHRENRTL